jgi:AntA/AntB antirepressor.
MYEYSFEEEKDFRSILSKSTGGRPSTDYEITLDMVKVIGGLKYLTIKNAHKKRRLHKKRLQLKW